jgi:hypothetical protein
MKLLLLHQVVQLAVAMTATAAAAAAAAVRVMTHLTGLMMQQRQDRQLQMKKQQ